MNGHRPTGGAPSAEEIVRMLDSLPDAALQRVRAHLDERAQHRDPHGDDPTEAPES